MCINAKCEGKWDRADLIDDQGTQKKFRLCGKDCWVAFPDARAMAAAAAVYVVTVQQVHRLPQDDGSNGLCGSVVDYQLFPMVFTSIL